MEFKNIASKALGPLNGFLANLKQQIAQSRAGSNVAQSRSSPYVSMASTATTSTSSSAQAQSLFDAIDSVANMLLKGHTYTDVAEDIQVSTNMAVVVNKYSPAFLAAQS
jgi:hypothetical protein